MLRLTLLAPGIVEAILDGRQQEGMTLPELMEPFPVEWERQCGSRRPWSADIKRPVNVIGHQGPAAPAPTSPADYARKVMQRPKRFTVAKL